MGYFYFGSLSNHQNINTVIPNLCTKKYLSQQDIPVVGKAYEAFSGYFLNPEIQKNIRDSKEEQFQEGFLRELFVRILG